MSGCPRCGIDPPTIDDLTLTEVRALEAFLRALRPTAIIRMGLHVAAVELRVVGREITAAAGR
jgi:hypothetical protein